MSRIQVNIERLVLKGFAAGEARALTERLQSQLQELLRDGTTRGQWVRSHRTPVVKLGRMPVRAGVAGAGNFGARLAGAISRKLKT
jgi:hypothetical protein